MKLIEELIQFALSRNLLSDSDKLRLENEGFFTFDWDEIEKQNQEALKIQDEDIWEEQSISHSRSSGRRHGKGKNHPAKPAIRVAKLNQLVQEEWDEHTKQFPDLLPLWESWKKDGLSQVLADGFTLNDVYAVLAVELRDYCLDYSGPEPAAYRQLLRQVGNSMGKYSWVMKSPVIALMIEFASFRCQLLEEVKTLCETDRETFNRLSSQNGRLLFHGWEKSVQTDTTSLRVWTILDLSSTPVMPER
ncbi:MAG: hypothetical protein K6C40_13075, partial [Thermoguttaceae bacterium]|nr:hypothetical protein [Thermoguttaceae bacterium]